MNLLNTSVIPIVHWCVDLSTASQVSAELQDYLNETGKIDLGDPGALAAYNKAIVKIIAGLEITVPQGRLIPTICLRHAYLIVLVDSLIQYGATILEIGTGSSAILSQLAAKLYGMKVIATEVDPLSFTSARNNIVRNGLSDQINLVKSDGKIITGLLENYLPVDALVTYPPVYPDSDRQSFETEAWGRGFLGNPSEMIGGGSSGFEFIEQLLHEACQCSIRHITLLLIFKHHADLAVELLKEYNRTTYCIKLLAGTRKRYVVIGSKPSR